jgi:hypothetical protein
MSACVSVTYSFIFLARLINVRVQNFPTSRGAPPQ